MNSMILSFERARQKRMIDKAEISRLFGEIATDFPEFCDWASDISKKLPDAETSLAAEVAENFADKLMTIAALFRGGASS